MARSRHKETGAHPADGDTSAANPDRERVAMRAYELYLARGGGDGKAMDDWLRAERELNARTTGGDRDPGPNRREEF